MFKDWQNKVNLTALSAVVAVGAVTVWLTARGFVTASLALFALILALPALCKAGKRVGEAGLAKLTPGVWEALAAYTPYAVVIIGTLVSLGPVSFGEMPVSQDHANHYYATHILVREMIATGRFFGWTDALGTGYPFGDTYHTPSYLITALLHLITFGVVDLKASYAFGIVIAWVVPVVAVTAWSRRIAGPVGAAVAGLAFALDMGSDREGGWIYAMFHGVWTQHVGAGVWALALLMLFRLTEKPTTRRLGAAALLSGISMWIHPMNSLTLLIGGVLLFVTHYLIDTGTTASDADKQRTVWLVPALFMAGIIGLVWVIRMMMAGNVVFAYAAYWQPLRQIATHLLEGELMDNQLALISALGLIGLARLMAAGGRFGTYTLLLPAICILVGSMALVLESDLGLAGGSVGIMQYRRFSVAAKPFWYAMSGAGVTAVGLALRSALQDRITMKWPARALCAAVLAPFIAATLTAVPGLFRSPVAMPLTQARTGDDANLRKLRDALAAEAKKCPKSGCRAVYFEKPGHGGLYPVISMADTGFAWQPTLTLPANNFKWINNTKNFDVMARRGVSVVISKWAIEHPRLKEAGVYGRHRLYRVKDVAFTPVEMEGKGAAEVISWAPEKRVIRISETDADSGIRIVQPPYRKWRAEQNGKQLPIRKETSSGQIVSVIEKVGDGELVLTYSDTAPENICFILGLLLIVACVVGVIAKPKPLPALPTGKGLTRAYHLLGVGAVALLVIGPVGMAIGGKAAARIEWLKREPVGTELKEVLHQRDPDRLRFSPEHYCVPAYVRNPEFGCNERDLLPYLTAAPKRRGKIPSCLAVGVPPKGKTKLTYRLPSGTTRLKGVIHHRTGGAAWAEIAGDDVGEVSRRGNRPFRIETDRDEESVTIVLTARQTAEVCLELAALGEK